MSEERAETFNLKGDYQFRLRYLDGRYRATIFQWDGTIRTSAAGPTKAVAWGQAVIELKKHWTHKRGKRANERRTRTLRRRQAVTN